MNSDQMYLNEGRGVINCAYGAFFIGPESDHWQCLSLTDSLTHSLPNSSLVNFKLKILNFKFCGDADVWLRFFVDA